MDATLYLFLMLFASLKTTSVFSSYVKFEATNFKHNRSASLCMTSQFSRFPMMEYNLNLLVNEEVLCTEFGDRFKGQMLVDQYGLEEVSLFSKRPCDSSFYSKPTVRVQYAQAKNASSMIFRRNKLHSKYAYQPFDNDTSISIPIYFINEHNFAILQNLIGDGPSTDVILKPKYSWFLNSSLLILMFLAVLCVALGALWFGYTFRAIHQALASRGPLLTTQKHDEPAATPLTAFSLGFFVLCLVTVLLLAYYFFDVLVWFFITMFTIGSSVATYACISLIQTKTICSWCENYKINFSKFFIMFCPCFKPEPDRYVMTIRQFLLYCLSASVSITWFIYRKNPHSFILHTILSVILCIFVIKLYRISTLKWITSLLCVLFVYDLFMVFITPFFTNHGCSVMVQAITGGADCHGSRYGNPVQPDEEMPIVFKFPAVLDPNFDCYNLTTDLQYPVAILGFGDVVLPGLLVGFNCAFDLTWCKFKPYYIVSLIGYIVGMIITDVVLSLTNLAQPALIYLVPFTLIPTHLLALYKKQWTLMWHGDFSGISPVERNVQSQVTFPVGQ